MGCTLEVALPSVKTRASDGNVRFDTCGEGPGVVVLEVKRSVENFRFLGITKTAKDVLTCSITSGGLVGWGLWGLKPPPHPS